MADNKLPETPASGHQDSIPTLTQIADEADFNAAVPVDSLPNTATEASLSPFITNDEGKPLDNTENGWDDKKIEHLRKQFEEDMKKKIRRTLQETERQLQKEMHENLDRLFKHLQS